MNCKIILSNYWIKYIILIKQSISILNLSLEMVFTPQPLRAPGYCRYPSGPAARRSGGRACGSGAGQTSPVNTLTSIIFHWSFSNLARTFITLRSVRSWKFCLIKYVHNGPFDEPTSFDIPELIFQAEVTKFGIKVGLNMLSNISSLFLHSRQNTFFANFFSQFPTSHVENHR